MKKRTGAALGMALAVGIFGGAVPGCWHPPAYPYGSFCASPANGGEHCVSAGQSPAGAWDQAAASGPEPIQMWAKWPDEVGLDDLIASQGKLSAWFGDIDTVSQYVRNERRSAESYRASLAGWQLVLLAQAADRQAALLAERPDPIGRFKDALVKKAAEEKDPLVAEVATAKQTMASAEASLDKAESDAAPLAMTYASLVTAFVAYRATEPAETAAYVSLSQQASAASLAELTPVEQAIVTTAQSASSQPGELTTNAMTLVAQIQVFETSAQAALAPYEDFLAAHGAAMPDMTSAALRSLHAMLGYIQQRVARSDATASTLLAGVAMRRKALEMLAAPPPPPAAKDVIAAAQARRAFVDAARAEVLAHRRSRAALPADQAARGTEAP